MDLIDPKQFKHMNRFLTALSILLIATAGYADDAAKSVITSVESVDPQAVEDYWTPERIKNAKPMEIRIPVPDDRAENEPPPSLIATVERVIDGNTLMLTNGEEVRLIGIDTPKMKANKGLPLESPEELAKGQEATKFTKELIEGNEVRLEFDVQERDKYGRLLAYVFKEIIAQNASRIYPEGVFIQRGKDSFLFVNAAIVSQGYATPMTIPPNVKYADLFKALYEEAREQKMGLWR